MIHQAQEKVFPTLVFLKPIRQQFGSGERVLQQVFGSGVIISPDGYVVTNSHVANETTEIKCVLFNSEELPARVVGLDEDTDLALIQIQLPAGHAPLPACEFADSDAIQPGQFVMALGSPFGFTRSISLGIIFARAGISTSRRTTCGSRRTPRSTPATPAGRSWTRAGGSSASRPCASRRARASVSPFPRTR